MKIGRKFSSVIHKVKKFGQKASADLKKAGGIGRKIADGISVANSYAQTALPALASVAGPYAPVVVGASAILNGVDTGIKQGRTIGASAVKNANRGADVAGLIAGDIKSGQKVKERPHQALQIGQDLAKNYQDAKSAPKLVFGAMDRTSFYNRPDVLAALDQRG